MLSVRPTTRKTYGTTASGKQITDDLIEALAGKAEAGYEIEARPIALSDYAGWQSACVARMGWTVTCSSASRN